MRTLFFAPLKAIFSFSLIVLISNLYCFGQNQASNWYFGIGAGVEFNSPAPSALLGGQTSASEGTSTISDSAGNLLYYSEGTTVWNKDHQVLLNGTGLLGNQSSTQSSIFVPSILEPNRICYLFTVNSGFVQGHNTAGLRYSKIDYCLDSLNGGIIPGEKNIKIVDTICEKIAVARHANGIDYWVLTHKFFSNEFWALHLGQNGIQDTVVTAIGSFHDGNLSGTIGQLKFSNNGDQVAIAAGNDLDFLELFDFNKTTGVLSNFQPLDVLNSGNVYGVEFSPNDSKLYITTTSTSQIDMELIQFDLSAGSLSAINSSQTSLSHNPNYASLRSLQIGIDGKIYMTSLFNDYYLASIENPNNPGLGCNFQDSSISLLGQYAGQSLPSFIAGFDYSNSYSSCEVTNLTEEFISKTASVYPNPAIEKAYLNVNSHKSTKLKVELYNFKGDVVSSEYQTSTDKITISKNGLSEGFYLLKVYSNSEMIYSGTLVFN